MSEANNQASRLKDFAESFLNPERNGYAVTPAIQLDAARAGMRLAAKYPLGNAYSYTAQSILDASQSLTIEQLKEL